MHAWLTLAVIPWGPWATRLPLMVLLFINSTAPFETLPVSHSAISFRHRCNIAAEVQTSSGIVSPTAPLMNAFR